MEYLNKDYLALYNTMVCKFLEKNNLSIEVEECCDEIINVHLMSSKLQKIITGKTITSVINTIENLIENKKKENNVKL